MQALSRRSCLLGVGGAALAAALVSTRDAHATLVRGLTLAELVDRSERIVRLTALDSFSHYVELGGRRSLVTDTLTRVDDVLVEGKSREAELVIRTLGGRSGSVGEIVHGQAELALGQPCAAFLKLGRDGAHWMVGMAQGHYPLRRDGRELRLMASPNLPTIRDWQTSAVRRLSGKNLVEARRSILEQVAR